MRYYEINFDIGGQESDWSFYIKSAYPIDEHQVKERLRHEFIGVDGLREDMLEDINYIQEVDKEEFETSTGKEG